MDICFTFDAKYLQYVYVVIASIVENNQTKIRFHLISSNISKKDVQKIKAWIDSLGQECFLYQINNSKYSFCPIKNVDNNRLSTAAYYRIDIPQILPENIKKVLYLDLDVLVLKDISDLFNINIDNYPLAVVEVLNNYFNSGVMLMNLDYFRKNNLSEQLYTYIKYNQDKINFYDQDAFNNLLKGNWYKLPPKYNAGDILVETLENTLNMGLLPIYPPEQVKEARNNPAIVHYAGSFHYKLWYQDCIHSKQDLFLYYRSKTPFKDAKLKTHYILYLMKGEELPYTYVKELVKNEIDKAKQKKGIKKYIFNFMNRNVKSRKLLFTCITYFYYLKKKLRERNEHIKFV